MCCSLSGSRGDSIGQIKGAGVRIERGGAVHQDGRELTAVVIERVGNVRARRQIDLIDQRGRSDVRGEVAA
jgi:hypothetical protein